MTPHLRTFIAVNLSQECVDYISSLQSQLKETDPDFKWVKPENCHITLKFLGDISASSIVSIIEILRGPLGSTDSFHIQTSNVGAFPSLLSPKILWLGVNDQHNKLQLLFNIVEEKLSSLGFAREVRPFTAHITLARARSLTSIPLFNAAQTESIHITVKNVSLYQSILSLQEPQYVLLHGWSLK